MGPRYLTLLRRENGWIGADAPTNRKFWHEYLPRLKYHNPAISMTVDRTEDNSGSAPLTILFTSSPVDTQAPGPTQSTSLDKAASDHQPFDRTHLIEMKHKHPSEILEELLAVTQAREVKPTQEERMAMEELVDQRRRSDHDREMQKQVLAKKRREKEILEQARRSVEMQTG